MLLVLHHLSIVSISYSSQSSIESNNFTPANKKKSEFQFSLQFKFLKKGLNVHIQDLSFT